MAVRLVRTAPWLALLLNLTPVRGAFWTYTSRFAYSYSLDPYTYYDGEVTTDTYTRTRTVKSDVTPTATPFSTSTYDSYYYSSDLELIYAYYDATAVAESDLEPTYDPSAAPTSTTSAYVYTIYMMEVTYTAPASCPTQFTWTTGQTVNVPTEVTDQLTPLSTVTDTSTYYGSYVTVYLSDGAAPTSATESDFYYTYYVADCTTPYSYTYTGSPHSGGGSDSDIEVCSWYSGCTSLKTWVIIIASILPSLFVLGFLESWFWFRRLMLGKGCLRFGTICWIMISLWVACFTRSQSARSTEDQKLLREKWNRTGSGEAFKLWWKWGFRHAYPVPILGQYSRNTVGIVPEGQPLPPMGQAAPMYGAGGPPPPGAPGAMYPSGVPQGQAYMYPPPGWAPMPQGQGYPMPPPGQAYMPPPNGYYTEQAKEGTIVTETNSPAPSHPQPAPSPLSTVPTPPPNMAEAPSPVQYGAQQNPAEVPSSPQAYSPPNVAEVPAPPQFTNVPNNQPGPPSSPPPRPN